MKGITITTDNVISIVNVESNGTPLYRQMNAVVGGYYENVYPQRLPKGFVMVVNEESKLKNLPINEAGSYLYGSDAHGDYIAGNVIILKLGYYEGEPDVIGMSDDEAIEIMKDLLNNVKALKGAN